MHDKPADDFENVPPMDQEGQNDLPKGVKGWSWPAMLFPFVWSMYHRVWWGALALIPQLNILVRIFLAIKGRELAWKAREWDSVDSFIAAQKKWKNTASLLFLY